MRESRKTERMHLPTDSMELWLGSQKPSRGEGRHRNPPEDSFEAWMEKQVAERLGEEKAEDIPLAKADTPGTGAVRSGEPPKQ